MKNPSHRRFPVGRIMLASTLLLTAAFVQDSFAGETREALKGAAGSAIEAVTGVPQKQERLISLVVLLKEPRKLDEKTLGDTVSKAVGIAPDPDTVDKGFLVAKPPYYRVELKSGVYVINNIDKPYFENVDKLAAEIDDAELRRAVTGNSAWMSVDWAGKEEPTDLRATYRDMGKIAAALARPDALAIYSPEAGQLSVFNDSVATSLASSDPLQIFDVDADDVVSIPDNDPQMQAAQEKARKAWPEFKKAFEVKDGKDFAVSGRIVEGDNSEYMWLSVTKIDADKVHGTLDNAPVALTNLKMGQDLHINVSEIDDWIYIGRDEVPVGGFTREALARARDSAKNETK